MPAGAPAYQGAVVTADWGFVGGIAGAGTLAFSLVKRY